MWLLICCLVGGVEKVVKCWNIFDEVVVEGGGDGYVVFFEDWCCCFDNGDLFGGDGCYDEGYLVVYLIW